MKGPSQSGSITQTAINPTQQAQLPFLTQGWNTASGLAQNDPFQYFPGQTLANQNPAMGQGFNDLINTAISNDSSLRPAGNSIFFNAANGGMGVQNGPSFNALMGLANGTAAPTTDLAKTASGAYLNSNPYLNGMFNSASDAVTRAYQTATAPQTDANFEAAGRYGGGALANARSQNQQDLGHSLDNLSANIYGTDYEAERQRMDNAASSLGGLEGNAGSALQSGFQAGNNNQMQALGLFPGLLGAQYTDANAMTQGGQGLTSLAQQQIDDAMKRFYGNIQAPWQTNQTYLNQIGQPTSGSSTTTSPLLGPSPLSSALGIGMGLNSLTGGSLGSGIGSALGLGGKGSAAAGPTIGTSLGEWSAMAPAAAGGKGLSSILPFAAAA